MKILIITALLMLGATTFNSSSFDKKSMTQDINEISCFDSKDLSNLNSLPKTECETGGAANKCCPYWDVEYSVSFGFWVSVTCSTGGEFVCDSAACNREEVSEA